MALETYEQGLNIKHLDLDSLNLDNSLNRIPTGKDWEKVKDELVGCRTRGEWKKFRALAATVRWAFPDESIAADSEVGCIWEEMVKLISELPRRSLSKQATAIIETMTIFPDKINELPTDRKDLRENMKERIKDYNKRGEWLRSADTLFDVMVIASERHDNIVKTATEGAIKELPILPRKPLEFVRLAVKVKALATAVELPFQIEDSTWEKLERDKEHFKNQRNWYAFGYVAASMIILTADEVTISEGSLRVRQKQTETSHQDSSGLPEERNF